MSEKAWAFASLAMALAVNVGTVVLGGFGQPWQALAAECAVVALVTGVMWWRNHNVSTAAQVGQQLVDRLKAGESVQSALAGMLADLARNEFRDNHEGEE